MTIFLFIVFSISYHFFDSISSAYGFCFFTSTIPVTPVLLYLTPSRPLYIGGEPAPQSGGFRERPYKFIYSTISALSNF
jgi:hypothetical protein